MKRSSIILKIGSAAVVMAMVFSLTACGKSKSSAKTTATTEAAETTPAPTTQATTTVPTYSGPMTNDQAVDWEEAELEGGATVKVVKCTEDYINVRKGPGTNYEVVAKLANNMQVIVVAKTDSGWYKTQDGFYVSGDLLATS